MAAQKDHDMGPPLPKFGEWDVNNPASAEGFTVIFSKASNDKKTNNAPSNVRAPSQRNAPPEEKKWFCCF